MDQKKVLLAILAHRGNLEKMVLLVFLALREPKATGASLGYLVRMALRGGKGTSARQDFLVQQNIMMHTRKREMREFQVLQGPKELVAHKVLWALPEFLEDLGHQSLASEDPLDHQA